MELLVFLISLFGLLTLGIPIAIVLILCSIFLMSYMGIFDATIISQQMVMGTNNFPLMAIPFFMLAGEIMSKGGLSARIVDFANILVGRVKGGLGYAAVLASVLFAGLSGSAVAGAAAMGSILIPLMVKNNYKVDRSTGLICAGSIIAPIIPPSIPMIVLGSAVGISVGRLFMAGLVPGIIIGIAFIITWKWAVVKDNYQDIRVYTKSEAMKITKDSIPALIMPIIIIGGIRFGIFTPTEAGAFAVVYSLWVSLYWYKELKLSSLVKVFVDSARNTAIVMFIVAAASAVGWLVTVARIPDQFAALFSGLIQYPVILLLVINLFLFILGMVMDLTPNLLIFGPVLFPIIQKAGIDPYYFGVIMVLNLCIGLITPPVGTILYLGSSVGEISFTEVVKGVSPFLITLLLCLLLFIIFPQTVLLPLKLIMGY